MSSTYHVELGETSDASTTLLHVRFGESATNDRIVVDAANALRELSLPGGSLIKINGPASLPVAMTICHAVAHRYGAVAVYDPKLSRYVVCVSHDPVRPVGMLLE